MPRSLQFTFISLISTSFRHELDTHIYSAPATLPSNLVRTTVPRLDCDTESQDQIPDPWLLDIINYRLLGKHKTISCTTDIVLASPSRGDRRVLHTVTESSLHPANQGQTINSFWLLLCFCQRLSKVATPNLTACRQMETSSVLFYRLTPLKINETAYQNDT